MKPYSVERSGGYWLVGNDFGVPGTGGRQWEFQDAPTAYAVMAVLNELLADGHMDLELRGRR